MKLIDTIAVRHQGRESQVMLFVGDLAHLPEAEAVDVLVVSAFPNNYIPTQRSLIGALHRRGLSVAELASDKEFDLRQFSSCWLSRAIPRSDLHFQRILCFETPAPFRERAAEVVGDIFQSIISIIPFTAGQPRISQIAMPLVASGDRGEPAEVILEVLVDAAVQWLRVGLPLARVKIVLHQPADIQPFRHVFGEVKQRYSQVPHRSQLSSFEHDVFLSYSHKNKEKVKWLVEDLRAHRPSLRIFVDELELVPGSAWQQNIFETLDRSRKVICILSPGYVDSKVCKEEYNIALFRHRDSADGVLLPVWLETAPLPTYMKLVQCVDVREGDRNSIRRGASVLLNQI